MRGPLNAKPIGPRRVHLPRPEEYGTLAVLYLQEVKYLLLDVTLSTVSKAYAATRTSTLAARTQSPERRKWRTHGPLLDRGYKWEDGINQQRQSNREPIPKAVYRM